MLKKEETDEENPHKQTKKIVFYIIEDETKL